MSALGPATMSWLEHRTRCQQCHTALEIYGVKRLGDPPLTDRQAALLRRMLCPRGRKLRDGAKAEGDGL